MENEKKVIKNSLYYYGIEISLFRKLPYEDVILRKIVASKLLLNKLFEEGHMENYHQINDISCRIESDKELLKDVGYTMIQISQKLRESFPP